MLSPLHSQLLQLTHRLFFHRSNNPFAPSPSISPSFSSPGQTNTPSFNLGGTYDNGNHSGSHLSSLGSSSPVPPSSNPYSNQQQEQGQKPLQVKTRKELGENEQHLASLFANRDDGTDTFGNFGALRYVVQLQLYFYHLHIFRRAIPLCDTIS